MAHPQLWKYKNLLIEGYSLAGISTAFALPQYSLAFDVGHGLPHILSMKNFFISHGHMDHASGIPYVLSQKALQNVKGTRVYMPRTLVEPMKQIMDIWSEIEKHEYIFSFVGLENNDEIILNDSHFVKAFSTTHRIPSLGYTLFHKKKKLKQEYRNLTGFQIAQLKKQGQVIEDTFTKPLFSFTGDTTIDVFNCCPWLQDSEVLFIEVTYFDDTKSIEHARKWGHIHFDELVPLFGKLQCERIVLIHASSRYSPRQLLHSYRDRVPKEFRDRVEIFWGR